MRFIGGPASRIAEDYLRILRFFRFSARFAGQLDAEALAAIRVAAPRMDRLSGERIRDELLKLLAGPVPAEMWAAMRQADVLAAVLPQATDAARLALVTGVETRHGLADALRRLMATIDPVPDGPNGVAERLKLSNAQRVRLVSARNQARTASLRAGRHGQALYKSDPVSVMDTAVLDAAETGDDHALQGLLAFLPGWRSPRFPLGGGDVAALGLSPGPVFGQLLGEVEAWWVRRDFMPTIEECRIELRRVARSLHGLSSVTPEGL